MQEKENIIDILERTKEAIKSEDVVTLKELSNRTVHSVSIYKDTDNVAVAVIVYSLSKIIERKDDEKFKEIGVFSKNVYDLISKAVDALKKDDETKFRNCLSEIRKSVNKLSGKLRGYIQDVFRKAEINKASKIYEHGISMEQTAQLLGITVWELSSYVGQKGMDEPEIEKTIDVKTRIKFAMDIFK